MLTENESMLVLLQHEIPFGLYEVLEDRMTVAI